METIDFFSRFAELDALIPKLMCGKIQRIIYGKEEGFGNNIHQISIIPTFGGSKIAFHSLNIHDQRGSGDYLDTFSIDEIKKRAQIYIQHAHRELNNPKFRGLVRGPDLYYYGKE